MRKHLQATAMLLLFAAIFGLGWGVLASPVMLTVTPYADLVRFVAQGSIKEFQVKTISLSGQELFDSGIVNNSTLDWRMGNLHGRPIATGIYLYTITVKDTSGNVTKHFGKLALIRGKGNAAPTIITTPAVNNPTPVQPNWTACANPCAEIHQGDITIQTIAATSWAKFDSVNQVLGIGTASPNPGTSLHVKSALTPVLFVQGTDGVSGHDARLALITGNSVGSGQAQADLQFFDNTSTLGFRFLAAFGNVSSARYGGFIAYRDRDGNKLPLRFFTSDLSDNLVTGVYIEAGARAGDVGFGTTAPTAQVHVNNTANQPALKIDASNGTNAIEVYNTGAGAATGLIYRVERSTGNVYADGSFNCGLTSGSCFNAGTGADVAERIDAIEPMEAGDVVEIHPEQAAKFRKSQSAISTRVAGIISTAPAVTLGNNFDGSKEQWNSDTRPLLALAGRVPVKVMAKYGVIKIGDLLVSSPIPGYAMKCPKASECIGAVIGKALEPLAEGVGKIEVQVMLR